MNKMSKGRESVNEWTGNSEHEVRGRRIVNTR